MGLLQVLILVLMEDTLREVIFVSLFSIIAVLILVLMEDTLRGDDFSAEPSGEWS